MADALIAYLRATLPREVATQTESHIQQLEQGEFEKLLRCEEARLLFGKDPGSDLALIEPDEFSNWSDFIFHRLGMFCGDRSRPERQVILFCIGYAALLAFIQSNVTGPPLDFEPSSLLLPHAISPEQDRRQDVKRELIAGLTVDGIAAYKLTPNIELLCFASAVVTCPPVLKKVKASRWAKLRTAFFHQRLLSEVSATLQDLIYDDLALVEEDLKSVDGDRTRFETELVLERTTIHIHHGLDKLARTDLQKAKNDRRFEYALTGLLGKRTKFQENDISQLVVLAKSGVQSEQSNGDSGEQQNGEKQASTRPDNLDLNDDTLLESISFSERPAETATTDIQDKDLLPYVLKALDPSDQPQLEPLDSAILLLFASSITNTSPQDGLTREQTVPYATRVLEGGSSNWQVYTQALLVRSRVEGYRSRTVERGLLQLQALVDQVIADTTGEGSSSNDNAGDAAPATTFLPKAKQSESAPVTERLRYIFQLATPTRWELEAELASRWVSLGGLRSALEIYERLEMWAEAALCWAATEREDRAWRMVRKQLFHATNGAENETGVEEEWTGPAREPPPLDAPRLYCILGDIAQSTEMYEKAWEVSGQRYARAQRSIGRYFFAARDYVRAAEAYSKSLKVNQLNHQSWFALGCALLELAQFEKAVEAFSRCVQLDESDAEAWSNLAAALLRTDPNTAVAQTGSMHSGPKLDDEDENDPAVSNTKPASAEREQSLRHDALQALKRAASLKHDSHRIWENVLVVAASLSPPDYSTILSAQRQLITLRAPTIGEQAIDIEILATLVNHVISSSDTYDPSQPGLARMVVKFVDESIVPLITGSADLWRLIAKLSLWRKKPASALDAEEKAWRATTSQPGWETTSEKRWDEIVDATVRLCDAYESLGQQEKTEGLAAGSGEIVMKDWRFKARSAVRRIMGRGKDSWEETRGWARLKEVTEGLRG